MSVDGRLVIGGRRRRGRGTPLVLREPSTGLHLATVPEADAADVDEAVATARRAVDGGEWARIDAIERARLLRRCADAVESSAVQLARLQAREMGRPVTRGREADVPDAAHALRYFAGLAETLQDEPRATAHRDARLTVRPLAAGVVAAIVPWNMPILLSSWTLAPALAAGCSVVLKPSEGAPLAAIALCERLVEAGLPADAVAALPGRGETTGAALVAHPDVDVVAFTGSVAAGRRVAASAGARGARVTLELGGKNALIVMGDANLDAAVEGAIWAGFANAGQACSAGSRVLVDRRVSGRFIERLALAARALRPGHALDPATRLGPLASADHRTRVLEDVAAAVAAGATALTGPGAPRPEGGWYVEPTVLVDVPPGAAWLREEIFGPVVTVEIAADEAEAVEMANDTPFGLTGGVWTSDASCAQRVARGLRAGTVWVNCWHRYDPAAPFGGVGASGFGRSGGPESLARFIDPISIWTLRE